MYESSPARELLFPVTWTEPIPSAKPIRESRVNEELRDLLAIEPHELVYRKCSNVGEGKGMRVREESGAATADGRLAWSESGQLERSSPVLNWQ